MLSHVYNRHCFTPGSTPLFFPNTAGAKKGFIHFSLAGKGDEASQSWVILVRSLKNR